MFDLIEKFIEAHQLFCGSVLAFFTSMIRLWRKSNSFILLCSIMTVGIYYTVQALYSCPETIAIAIGSGTEKMKELILKHFGDVENVDKQ